MSTARLHTARTTRALVLAIAFLLALAFGARVALAQGGATIAVNTTLDTKADDGACSLREAIIAANTNKATGTLGGECAAGQDGRDLILLPPDAVYTLTRPAVGDAAADSGSPDGDGDRPETGDLHITSDLTIQPAGSGVAVIQGGPGFNSRIFHVTGGQPIIQGVTILWGSVNINGGAILNNGTLALNNSTVVRTATAGTKPGIVNTGTATLTNVTVNATVNETTGGGAALANAGGTLTLLDSIVANGACSGTVSGSATTNVAYVAPGCPGVTGDPLLQPQTIPALFGVPAYYVPGEGGSAHDAGTDGDAGAPVACLLPADQIGASRPQGAGCDVGAIEADDGFLAVTSCADAGAGTLRAAIEESNAALVQQTIIFDLPAACNGTIAPASALPAITEPMTIDGKLGRDGQPDPAQSVTLDGGGQSFDGLLVQGGGNGATIRNLTIRNFRSGIVLMGGEASTVGNHLVEQNVIADNLGSGVVLLDSDGNTIRDNTITGNGFGGVTLDVGGTPIPLDDGITAISGINNLIANNNIYGNAGQPVDLGGDGPTPNDPGDDDGGPNFIQNHPVLFRAALAAPSGPAALQGWLDSRPGQSYTLRFYAGASCESSALALVGESSVTTPAEGTVYFDAATVAAVQQGDVVLATATDAAGNTSELAPCARVGYANDSWPAALPLSVAPGGAAATIEQYLDLVGQSRWYKIPVTPGSRVRVELTNLPANYDLTVYKDIRQVYDDLNDPQGAGDLSELGAEFAADAFAAQGFAAQGFAAQGFAAQGFAAQGFAAQGFAAQGFAAQGFAAQGFAAQGFAAQGFAADAVSEVIFSPDAFLSQAFAAQGFAPDAYYPDAFDPAAFSDAPQRSLLGLSAFENTAPESLVVNTWANTGDFYIKVRGRQGAFSPLAPYRLAVSVEPGLCDALFADARLAQLNALPAAGGAPAGNFTTLVLADWSRYDALYSGDATLPAMKAQLAAFVARPEVRGVTVDVGAAAKVALANALGDQYVQCPYAKNLVAGAVKEIADASRAANPGLRYVVLIGGDNVIPFFRSPDTAPLGSESDYFPPVDDDTASQASLRHSYYMHQDGYGAQEGVSFKDGELPVPDLAVGRLLETPAEVRAAFDAYLATPDGVAPPPQNALVTGYDFMHDAATAVRNEFAGAGLPTDALLTEPTVSPLVTSTTNVSASPFAFDGKSWTAGQLGTLLERRHDVAFLAGHFSAASALAADYSSAYAAHQLRQSPVNLANALVFSNGCHSGYNTVLEHALPWTAFPSWPQVFVGKGAVLIGGTGYQYGDTDFLEYSERLYRDFARALRTGDGPIAVGDALMAAKRKYLAETPRLRGIHEKSLLQAAIYGLPMLKIDMPGSRYTLPETSSVVPALTPVASLPGSAPLLSLHSADVSFTWATMEERALPLKDIKDLEGGYVVTTTWLVGENGVVSNPGEPAVPLIVKDVSAPAAFPGYALRGVGLRSATYSDTPGVQPLVGAPTTELRGVHQNLLTPIWFPVTPWSVNYFDALESGAGGTRLNLQAAQYRAPSPLLTSAIRRRYSSMDFRLFYSASTAANGANLPALSAAPSIVQVLSAVDGGNVRITVQVVANPGSGVQEVWATYTGTAGPYHGQWQSLDLVQNPGDSTLWEGVVPLNGTSPAAFQFIVQAAGGNGLVGRSDNMGRYFSAAATGLTPATLTLAQAAASGAVGTTTYFTATLLGNGVPLANQAVAVALGGVTRVGVTGSDGTVSIGVPLLTVPGDYAVAAWFAGDATYAPATAGAVPFAVAQQGTLVRLRAGNASQVVTTVGATLPISATLADAGGRLLPEQAVTFIVANAADSYRETVITDLVGRAYPRLLAPPPGIYSVTVEFPGNASYTGSTSNQLQLSVGEAPLVTLLPMVLNEGDPPGE